AHRSAVRDPGRGRAARPAHRSRGSGGDPGRPGHAGLPPAAAVLPLPLRAPLDGRVTRACRRLRPFGLGAGAVTVEVRRLDGPVRRTETVEPEVRDHATARAAGTV